MEQNRIFRKKPHMGISSIIISISVVKMDFSTKGKTVGSYFKK